MGFHKPVFSRAILGGTVHRVMTGAESDVAVFVDRGFVAPRRVLVPFLGGRHDLLAVSLAARLARHAGAEVTVLHVVPPGGAGARSSADRAREDIERVFNDPAPPRPLDLRVVEDASPVDAVLRVAGEFDLVIVGVSENW